MKRHLILCVLWLMGCGAGSPTDDSSDSTLESPLTAEDDDISSDDLADSELASEFIPNAADDEASDDEASDDEASDDEASDDEPATGARSDADEAPEAAPGAPPVIVIGAGGEPWEPAGDGVVVWCHASVPLGCPAIEPAPSGGHLVVVTRSTETGEFEQEAAGEPAIGGAIGGGAIGGGAIGAGASAPAPGTPAPGTAPAPGAPAASGVPAPARGQPGAPRPPLPVDVGGSLPPLPGTCVAITFAGAGGAGQSASGSASAPTFAGGERAAGTAPLPAPGEAAMSVPLPPLPGVPGLPPSGGCIGVGFAAPPALLPVEPPSTGAGPIGVPMPPAAGACIGVAFAAASGEGGAAGTPAADPVPAGVPAPHAPGMPFVCAAQPPLPGMSHPGSAGAPLPSPARGSHIEVHHTSDAAPATDEAGADEVR
jgi:hypothetical protein